MIHLHSLLMSAEKELVEEKVALQFTVWCDAMMVSPVSEWVEARDSVDAVERLGSDSALWAECELREAH